MPEHEIRTVTTLTKKRDEIIRVIAGYERALEQARADLAAIKAAIVVFERNREAPLARPYDDLSHLFRYGELRSLCLSALAEGPLTTPEIAAKVAVAKGFDTGDRVMLKTLGLAVVHAMRALEGRRKVRQADKGRVITWASALPVLVAPVPA